MAEAESRPLTERQAAVMERIDRRVPIKVIAQEMGVSETRINQHIRALKNIYDVTNLGDLVEEYRADLAIGNEASSSEKTAENQQPQTSSKALSEDTYSFPQVSDPVFGFDNDGRDSAATVEMSDVLPLIERAPWLRPGEPKVVPGLLDGEHAVMFRLAAIIGIAVGFLAAVVLTVTAAMSISEALDGRADIPVDQQGFS